MITQKVTYDWKPTLCDYCHKYGHDKVTCRKNKSVQPEQHEEQNVEVKEIAEDPQTRPISCNHTDDQGRVEARPTAVRHINDQSRFGYRGT